MKKLLLLIIMLIVLCSFIYADRANIAILDASNKLIILDASDSYSATAYNTCYGISSTHQHDLVEDADHNIWVSCNNAYVTKHDYDDYSSTTNINVGATATWILAYDSTNDYIWVGDYTSGGDLIKINPSTHGYTAYSTTLDRPNGVGVDSAGDVYSVSYGTGTLVRLDESNSYSTSYDTVGTGVYSDYVHINSLDNILWTDHYGTSYLSVKPDWSTNKTSYGGIAYSSEAWAFFAIDSNDDVVVGSNKGAGSSKLIALDKSSSYSITNHAISYSPGGISIEPDNDNYIWVADRDAKKACLHDTSDSWSKTCYTNTVSTGNSYVLLALETQSESTTLNITKLLLTSTTPDQNLTTDIQGNTTDTTPTFQVTTNIAATAFDINGTTACTTSDNITWTCTHSTVLSDGLHNITINGTDGTNTSTITREVLIDGTNPDITFNSPISQTYNQITGLTAINLSVTCSDTNDIKNITMYVNGTVNATNTTPVNNTAWVYNFTPSAYINYTINFSCYDNIPNYNSNSTERWFSFTNETSFNVTLQLSNYTKNITAELGSNIIVNSTIDDTYTVCVDIDHPDYGINYSCAVNSTLFNLSIDYFRTNEVSNNTFECYQEFANVTTNCGGLNTGTYSCVNGTGPSWSDSYPCENTIDGLWDTGGSISYAPLSSGKMYVNYTVPNNVINATLLIYLYSELDELVIPNSCINDNVEIEYEPTWTGGIPRGFFRCKNSTGWQLLLNSSLYSLGINEEGMLWTINTTSDTIDLTYLTDSLENKTFYINSNHYDEIVNLSFNITVLNLDDRFSNNIKIFVNNTLSNDIGDITGKLTEFSDSTSIKNITFTDEGSTIVGYFKLPKNTTVNSASFDIKGYNHTYFQATSENQSIVSGAWSIISKDTYYEKKNRTVVNWEISIGNGRQNVTLNSACQNANNDWLLLGFEGVDGSQDSDINAQCNDITLVNNGGVDGYKGKSDSGWQSGTITIYDGDWDTFGCPVQVGTGYTYWMYALTREIQDVKTVLTCEDLGVATLYDSGMWWNSYTRNPWLEIGELNGTYDWNYTGLYSGNESIIDFSDKIEDYLEYCIEDENGYCEVPVYLYSDIGGIIEISNIEIDYRLDVINPIIPDIDLVQSFLDDSSDEVDIPIIIQSSTIGIIEISDIKYDYRGGNKTYTVTAHDSDYNNETSYNVTYYYSDWEWSFPNNIDYIEFIPYDGPTQKNVTPYGQTSTRPILNFTSQATGGKNFNFTILLNESFTCVDDTVCLVNNKSNGTLLVADTWINYKDNVTYESTFDMYTWADFSCSYDNWYLWNPYWYLRACCLECDICDSSVVNVVEI